VIPRVVVGFGAGLGDDGCAWPVRLPANRLPVQDQTVNTAANPAAKGSIISLFAGEGGQTSPQGIDGLVTSVSVLLQLMQPVSVTIGGVAATDISYAGSAPGLVASASGEREDCHLGGLWRCAGRAEDRKHDQPIGADGQRAVRSTV
jgi:hypothetical protein